MFPNADSERQGFLRIINHSKIADNAIVEPCDDARPCDRISLTIDADETVHFNSDDLAMGNEDKGLSRGVGSGTGDWNLRVVSALNLEVLAYVRTQDGFLTAMHDVVEREEDGHYRVANFNPGRNEMQASLLRLLNPNGRTVEVAIAGIDDKGLPSESVRVPLFPAAGDSSGRQGFVRVINHSPKPPRLSCAHDNTGRDHGSISLELEPNETAHFNSDDLELGNEAKGLSGGAAAPASGMTK